MDIGRKDTTSLTFGTPKKAWGEKQVGIVKWIIQHGKIELVGCMTAILISLCLLKFLYTLPDTNIAPKNGGFE